MTKPSDVYKATVVADVLKRVEAFLADSKMSATAFGLAVANNTALVGRLRDGNVSTGTLDAIAAWLDKHDKKKKAA